MAHVTWTPRLSVGVEKFDKQHQRWMNLLNVLHEAMRTGKGRAVVGGILEEVMAYTRTHFQEEESAMEQAKYPSVREHRALHDGFVGELSKLQKAHAAGDLAISIAVSGKLADWFTRHIAETDQQYAPFMKTAGIR